MLTVTLPNPEPDCAPPGAAKCDVRVDWDAGVLHLCTYRVITPGPHECPMTVSNECPIPSLRTERTWVVKINGHDAFTIDSRLEPMPEMMDRCTDLRDAAEVGLRARR